MISCTHKIQFVHVKGHSKNEWNEIADAMAKRGAHGEIKSPSWESKVKNPVWYSQVMPRVETKGINAPIWYSKVNIPSQVTYYANWLQLGKLSSELTERNLVRDEWGKPWPGAILPSAQEDITPRPTTAEK